MAANSKGEKMRKPIFALCDKDEAYQDNLFEYLKNKKPEGFEIMLFTDLEKLKEAIKAKEIKILLIAEELTNEIDEDLRNQVLVLITLSVSSSDSENKKSIFKYQSAEEIYKQVMHFCEEADVIAVSRKEGRKIKILGVYSPIKRCLQTTFSITLGQLLSKNHKTLYINFENYSGFDILMHKANSLDLMDLVYFLGCGNENFSYRLGSLTEHIGELDYIPPVNTYQTLQGVSSREWINFLKAFEEYTDYEYIILDLSENIMGLFEILRRCSSIFTITSKDRFSQAKISQYEKMLSQTFYEDILEKTNHISFPKFKEIPEAFEMLPYSKLSEFIRKEVFKGQESLSS